jgi:hypothetical protein
MTILPPGGELTIGFKRGLGGGFQDVTLAGPTELVATGEIDDGWLAARGLAKISQAA